MTTTVVTTKGQIVIPAKIRRRLNIKKGTRLSIEERKGDLILRTVTAAYFNRIAGVLATKGKLAKALVAERRREREKEA